MTRLSLSRRAFLGGAAASPFVLSGISSPVRAADITVGIIYVGSRQDYGWNQAHAVGAQALKEIPGVKVVEEENVPETVAVAKTMESMINIDGATLLFPTSFGYFNPFMVDAAKKYPKIEFRHPTSLWQADKHPANAGGYFCYLDQGHYVNGMRRAFRPSPTRSATSRPSRSRWFCATSIRSCSAPARSIPMPRCS
jgi:simple sugar transport system substrate-binding protein